MAAVLQPSTPVLHQKSVWPNLVAYMLKNVHVYEYATIIWASTRETLSSGVCEQHRSRPACASAQSDQRLCYSLFGNYHMLTCYRWFFFLASHYGWGDWFETRFAGNPEDRFCRVEAQMLSLLNLVGFWMMVSNGWTCLLVNQCQIIMNAPLTIRQMMLIQIKPLINLGLR